MNKVINKALFYKEWINVRWVTVITIIVLLFYKLYAVISLLNQNTMYMKYNSGMRINRWFNNGLYGGRRTESSFNNVIYGVSNYYFVMIFVVIILAIILFTGEKTSETEGFIASMPFTRKEIVFNKWIVGVLSLLISFIVTYIFLSLFYVANINDLNTTLNPYSDLVKWFFMDSVQYICIFTFMMLAQTVMGNSIVAGIVGGMIPILPYFIIRVVRILITLRYGFIQYIVIGFNKIEDWLNIYSYNLTYQNWVSTETNASWFDYTNYKLKLLVLIILTCLFLYLAYVSYKKVNLEYNLRLIVFENLEHLFTWVVAICLGFFGGYILGVRGIWGIESLNSFWICFVSFTIIGYFISTLLLKVLSSRK